MKIVALRSSGGGGGNDIVPTISTFISHGGGGNLKIRPHLGCRRKLVMPREEPVIMVVVRTTFRWRRMASEFVVNRGNWENNFVVHS